MSAATQIPLKEIHMKHGINIGGFQYRIYQTGPSWELHLHPVGSFVSLRHVESRTTYYVHLSLLDAADGFADYATPVSPASDQRVSPVPNGGPVDDATSASLPPSQGLVSNQMRVPVKSDPLRQVDGAQDLGSAVSPEEKAAKEKHFGVKEAAKLLNSNEGDVSEDQDLDEETIVAAPVKKKRGRPRKVRPEDAVSA